LSIPTQDGEQTAFPALSGFTASSGPAVCAPAFAVPRKNAGIAKAKTQTKTKTKTKTETKAESEIRLIMPASV